MCWRDSCEEYGLILQRIQVSLPSPISGGSQLPLTSDARYKMLCTGCLGHLHLRVTKTQTQRQITHGHIHINNNKTKSEKNRSLMTEVEPTDVYNGKDFLFQD